MKPEDFKGTLAWKLADALFVEHTRAGESLYAKDPTPTGAAIAIAVDLYVAETILKHYGEFREGLEPLIQNFRETAAHLAAKSTEKPGDLH